MTDSFLLLDEILEKRMSQVQTQPEPPKIKVMT